MILEKTIEQVKIKKIQIKNYYYEKDIIKLDEKNYPLVSLTFDKMIKAIFIYDPNWLKEFILLQLPIELDFNTTKLVILNSEFPVYNKREYKKTVDIIVSLNDYIYVNLEINREKFNYIKKRNYIYKNKMIDLSIQSGEKIKKLENLYFYQINLNVSELKDEYNRKIKNGTRTIGLFEFETQKLYLNNDITFIKYLEFYRDLYYNKNTKLTKSEMWLVMLTSRNYKELYETLGHIMDDYNRNKFIRKVIELSSDKFIMSGWNEELWADYVIYQKEQEKIKEEEERKKREEERKRQDEIRKIEDEERTRIDKTLKERDNELKEREIKLEKRNNEIIINMLEKNTDINFISEVTNLSIEEIIKIKETIK